MLQSGRKLLINIDTPYKRLVNIPMKMPDAETASGDNMVPFFR